MFGFGKPKRKKRKLYGAAKTNAKRTHRKRVLRSARNTAIAYGSVAAAQKVFLTGVKVGAFAERANNKEAFTEAYEHGRKTGMHGAMEFGKQAYARGWQTGKAQGERPRIKKEGSYILLTRKDYKVR